MNVRTLVARSALAAALLVSCKEHAYRHEVEGQILDAKGAPVAGVWVTRVSDKGEPYGLPDLYQRKTDETGHFSFVSEGRGPSPAPSAPWYLAVEVPPRKDRARFEVTALWSDDRATCFGYCAKNLKLIVK